MAPERESKPPTGDLAMIEGGADQSLSTNFQVASQDSSKATSVLGERDRRIAAKKDLLEHLNGRFFEVHPVVMYTVTTNSFLIACEKASTIQNLLGAVQEIPPAIAITRILNSKIFPKRILLMQETNTTNSHRRWDTIGSKNDLGYHRYLHRNIVSMQPERPLRVEIHLIAEGMNGGLNHTQLEQMLKEAGNGLDTIINTPQYRQVAHLKTTLLNKRNWRVVPLDLIDAQELEECISITGSYFLRAPNTNTWMPNRKSKFPKKRKNGFFADKKAKKRRNKEAREANVDQDMADVQDQEVAGFSEGEDDMEDDVDHRAKRLLFAEGKENAVTSESNDNDHRVDGVEQLGEDDEGPSRGNADEAAAGAKRGAGDENLNQDVAPSISFDEVAEAITGIAIELSDNNESARAEDDLKELAYRGK